MCFSLFISLIKIHGRQTYAYSLFRLPEIRQIHPFRLNNAAFIGPFFYIPYSSDIPAGTHLSIRYDSIRMRSCVGLY